MSMGSPKGIDPTIHTTMSGLFTTELCPDYSLIQSRNTSLYPTATVTDRLLVHDRVQRMLYKSS